MALTVRITSMLVRICGLIALILGILFWTSSVADGLIPIHMLVGIILVLSLFVLCVVQALAPGGSWVLAALGILVGVVLAIVGMTQTGVLTGDTHWIIQVVHLLLALAAIGIGETAAARFKRGSSSVAVS